MDENDVSQSSPDPPSEKSPEGGSPEEGEHLESPEPGHPVDETQPQGGAEEGAHEHPEEIEDTTGS